MLHTKSVFLRYTRKVLKISQKEGDIGVCGVTVLLSFFVWYSRE